MAKKTEDPYIGKEYEGRCMRCKQQRPFTAAESKENKNGTIMVKGLCIVCNTTVAKFLAKPKVTEVAETESFADAETFEKF